jgi:hypothetical protein
MGGDDSSWLSLPHPGHIAHYPLFSTNNQEERETESVERMKARIKLIISERRESHADWRTLLTDGLGRFLFILSLSYRFNFRFSLLERA